MWNSEFLGSFFSFRIPHSTSRISIARPPGPRNDMRLMIFARKALASGPQACFFAEKKRTKVKKRES
jgi:hypothetical protein